MDSDADGKETAYSEKQNPHRAEEQCPENEEVGAVKRLFQRGRRRRS